MPRIDLTKSILIDQHAHSLLSGFLQLDEIGFRKCFTESRSLKMIERHVPHTLHYMELVRQLQRVFDVRNEEQYFELRQTMKVVDHVNCLFDEASFGALIIDDGFRSDAMITSARLAKLINRPIYRCLRLETILENAIEASSNFDDMLTKFTAAIKSKGDIQTVAVKSIAAYRGGLAIDMVAPSDARADFDRLKSERPASSRSHLRIEKRPLYHYALAEAFEIAGTLQLPVQVHCGIGDSDEDLREANPLILRNIFESKRFAETNFVLLHCYPYVREAAYLASLYATVYMDLSLAAFLVPGYLDLLILDALSGAPATKLLAGTDGHSVPETHWFGAFSLKRSLSAALNSLIDRDMISEEQANSIAAAVLYRNARELYKLDGLI